MTNREAVLGALLVASVLGHFLRPTHYEPPPVVRQEFTPKRQAPERVGAPETVPEPVRTSSGSTVRAEFTPHRARVATPDAGAP